jgi:hypothetical protein
MPGHDGPGNELPIITKIKGVVVRNVGRKLLATVLSVIFVFLNNKLSLGMSELEITAIVGSIVAFIIGQGIADAGKEKARIEQVARLKGTVKE